jgi:hypothetical protein
MGQVQLFADDALAQDGATFTDDRRYRYRLWRKWGMGQTVAFLGLNPSTADESKDDPTIRRCRNFAHAWGFDGMWMLNLYGWRSTDPRALWDGTVLDLIGPGHDESLVDVSRQVAFVVCAWGAFPKAQARGQHVLGLLHSAGVETRALGLTASGFPAHPLYLLATSKPSPWPVLP